MENSHRYALKYAVSDDTSYSDLLAELYRDDVYIGKFKMDNNNWPFRMEIQWSDEMLEIIGELIEIGLKIREREKQQDVAADRFSQEIVNYDP